MKSIDEIISEIETPILEGARFNNQLQFLPVEIKAKESKIKYGVCVGSVFSIKDVKYCDQMENFMKTQMGLVIKSGIAATSKVIKKNTIKLIYLIYDINKVMICDVSICKSLTGMKLK